MIRSHVEFAGYGRLLMWAVLVLGCSAPHAAGRVEVSSSGHYFTFDGQTRIILADSGTQAVMQNLAVDYRGWVDTLDAEGHKSAHIWSFVPPRQQLDGSELEDRWGYVYPGITPWARRTSGALAHDGGRMWDLLTFDEGTDPDVDYWPRLRDLCSRLDSRDMMLGITVFFGWPKDDGDLLYHPFHELNGGPATNRQDITFVDTPGTEIHSQSWDDAWPARKRTQWLWEKFALKLIETAESCGNVWFDFRDEWTYDNDTNAESHFRDFFMSRDQIWADRSSTASFRVSNPAVDGFGSSPSMKTEGGPYDAEGVLSEVWVRSMSGIHYLLHNDSRTPGIMAWDPTAATISGTDPQADLGRQYVGHASAFFNDMLVELDAMSPNDTITTTGEGLAAVNEYVIYLPSGGSTTLGLSGQEAFEATWFNPRTADLTSAGSLTGSSTPQSPPGAPWVLHLRKLTGPAPPLLGVE